MPWAQKVYITTSKTCGFEGGDYHLLYRVQGANENPANYQTFGNERRLFLPKSDNHDKRW
jgi:hypothetical protein